MYAVVVQFCSCVCVAAPASEPKGRTGEVIRSLEGYEQLMSEPPDVSHRFDFEITVLYYDPDWNVLWCTGGKGVFFLAPPSFRLPIRAGERYRMTGVARPGSYQVDWQNTSFERRPDVALPVPVRLSEDRPEPRDAEWVTMEGLVDTQVSLGPDHVRLDVIGPQGRVLVWLNDPAAAAARRENTFVRVQGVLSLKRKPQGDVMRREIWVARVSQVQGGTDLATDPRFEKPARPLASIAGETDRDVVVHGRVHGYQPGEWIVLRDATAQVKLLTAQTQPIAVGDYVDALVGVGGPESARGLQHCIFRPSRAPVPPDDKSANEVRWAEDIRNLDATAAGVAVELRGAVTWSSEHECFFFVEDATGGAKVELPQTIAPPHTDIGVVVRGKLSAERALKYVQATALLAGAGDFATDDAPLVTYDQASSGEFYARLVRMRGFVRSQIQRGDYVDLQLSTPAGEVLATIERGLLSRNVEGAVVEIAGVCDAEIANSGRPTGVRLWVAAEERIHIVSPPQSDPFRAPVRTIRSVLQFNANNNADERVRVRGVVLMQQPGEFVCIQEDGESLQILTRDSAPLRRGDIVEAVGFPGHEGWRPVLREGALRKVGQGPAPVPIEIAHGARTDMALDGVLVSLTGTLLSVSAQNGGTAGMQLLCDGAVVDVRGSGDLPLPLLKIGAKVRITGVYWLDLDVHRTARGFYLRLGDRSDVELLANPPWWTPERAIGVGIASLIFVGAATASVLVLSRKNKMLRSARAELRRANAELETRVADRTRDLTKEVAARTASEEMLSRQQRLLRTLIDGLPVSLYIKDAAGRYLACNDAHAQCLGLGSAESAIGKTSGEAGSLEDPPLSGAELRAIASAKVISEEEKVRTPSGEVWFWTTLVPTLDAPGHAHGLIGFRIDITARKQAEDERERLQAELIRVSRAAGKAEVAANTLHAVGNGLNSVNVSAGLALKGIRTSKARLLSTIAQLFRDNEGRLPEFFATDPKANVVPKLVSELAVALQAEQATNAAELERLLAGVAGIQEVLSLQQQYVGAEAIRTAVDLGEVLRAAAATEPELQRLPLAVDARRGAAITTDPAKVADIFRRLVVSAAQAGSGGKSTSHPIRAVILDTPGAVGFEVADSGALIPADELPRVFAQGFQSSSGRNGALLHEAAVIAHQIGATIAVTSRGNETVFTVAFAHANAREAAQRA